MTNYCKACDRDHVSPVTGKPIPFCGAHIDPVNGECDARGSHFCGPSEMMQAISTIYSWKGSK